MIERNRRIDMNDGRRVKNKLNPLTYKKKGETRHNG